MDANFIGVIYQCFHENANGSQRMQVYGFQSVKEGCDFHHVEVTVEILQIPPGELQREFFGLANISHVYYDEEMGDSRSNAMNIESNAQTLLYPFIHQFSQ